LTNEVIYWVYILKPFPILRLVSNLSTGFYLI